MDLIGPFIPVFHFIGLALALGCGTAKLLLLGKSGSDHSAVSAFLAVSRPLTRLIITGMVLTAVSGIYWLVDGYPFTTMLIVKLVLLGIVLVLGPVIDNVIEPSYRRLAPAAGEAASAGFIAVQRRYLLVEIAATGLFYAVLVLWMFR